MNGFIDTRSRAVCRVLCALCLLIAGTMAHADGQGWWRTPEQQMEAALESGDLLWQGIAEHESGDYAAAARSFDQAAIERSAEGQEFAANQALYNRGVSEVLNEQYEKAVQTFDQVLETDPEFEDAEHNRNIAMQLIQQQQEQQQQGQGGDRQDRDNSESSDSSDSEDPSDAAQDSESAQEGEQDESAEQQDAQSGEAGEQSGDSPDEPAASEAQRRDEEQAAREALQAEAESGNLSDEQGESGLEDSQQAADEPLSESAQATEQWLRRIPDDPAGLLRRKLLQSHQLEYPEVRDAQQPW